MRDATAKAINTLTADYALSLTKLRDHLQSELNQVNEQIRICEEFAGLRIPTPTASGTVIRGGIAGFPQAGKVPVAELGSGVRPKAPTPSILTEEDAKRLAAALEES